MSKPKPYIIAELGSNFTDFDSAKDAISIAKACGADAIKFQTFTYEDMYGNNSHTDWDMDLAGIGWLPKLKEKADACDIDFICTAFSPANLRYIDSLGVDTHKIASSDINYLELLETARNTGKKVLLSCGGSSFGDIKNALEVLNKQRTTVMYCCSEYPSTYHNLEAINVIRKGYNCNVGYSDHSIDVFTPFVANNFYGATIIEKHFKPKAEIDTPDSGHSLCPERFRYMCDLLSGSARLDFPTRGEKDMMLRHNRRLIVTKDLNVGDALEYGKNFGAYRSLVDDTRGLSPFAYKDVDGRRMGKGISKGTAIGPGDFK